MKTIDVDMIAGKLAFDEMFIGRDWLVAKDLDRLCSACAEKMRRDNIKMVKASVVREALFGKDVEADKWKDRPRGWTKESMKDFWNSLTESGSVADRVKKCIEKLEGSPDIDDAGAFCSSLADRLSGSTAWRSDR